MTIKSLLCSLFSSKEGAMIGKATCFSIFNILIMWCTLCSDAWWFWLALHFLVICATVSLRWSDWTASLREPWVSATLSPFLWLSLLRHFWWFWPLHNGRRPAVLEMVWPSLLVITIHPCQLWGPCAWKLFLLPTNQLEVLTVLMQPNISHPLTGATVIR